MNLIIDEQNSVGENNSWCFSNLLSQSYSIYHNENDFSIASDYINMPPIIYQQTTDNVKIAPFKITSVKSNENEENKLPCIKRKKAIKKFSISQKQKEEIRAESNRRSARESRERKKLYIYRLESEVAHLQMQVNYYKTRLGRYEIIEQHRNTFGYEIYNKILTMNKEIFTTPSEPHFANEVKSVVEKSANARLMAIEELTKAIIEIVTPSPWRFFFWASKKNLDITDHSILSRIANNKMDQSHIKYLGDRFKNMFGDPKKFDETRNFYVSTGDKLKGLIKKIVRLQKHIQTQLLKITKHSLDRYMMKSDPTFAQLFAQFLFLVKDKPELSNYGICQLNDEDFKADETFASANSTKKFIIEKSSN